VNKIGCALLAVGLPVVGIAALVVVSGWLVSETPDQSHLTRSVTVTVVDSQEVTEQGTNDWALDYRYRVKGQWFAGEDQIDVDEWGPGVALAVCVDPHDPAQHVLKGAGDRCGDELIRTGINTGTETTAPEK
jgi:hypothetical protein